MWHKLSQWEAYLMAFQLNLNNTTIIKHQKEFIKIKFDKHYQKAEIGNLINCIIIKLSA